MEIVNMGYEVGVFEKPEVRWDQAQLKAMNRCRAWGYSDAQRFGGVQKQCLAYNGYGSCMRMMITVPYQCLGDGDD